MTLKRTPKETQRNKGRLRPRVTATIRRGTEEAARSIGNHTQRPITDVRTRQGHKSQRDPNTTTNHGGKQRRRRGRMGEGVGR